MQDKGQKGLSESAFLLSSQTFRTLASTRLHATPPQLKSLPPSRSPHQTPSDFDLNPNAVPSTISFLERMPAAVLVPLLKEGPLSVLLTKRTQHLPTHAGQISFPGGKKDPLDQNPLFTALREAKEEIGLDEVHVEPLGFLDIYYTVTGYAVSPVVAFLEQECSLTPNPEEVAEIFEVPLAFLMNPANLQIHSHTIRGVERKFYALTYKDYYIWGATAGILKNMYEKLFKP